MITPQHIYIYIDMRLFCSYMRDFFTALRPRGPRDSPVNGRQIRQFCHLKHQAAPLKRGCCLSKRRFFCTFKCSAQCCPKCTKLVHRHSLPTFHRRLKYRRDFRNGDQYVLPVLIAERIALRGNRASWGLKFVTLRACYRAPKPQNPENTKKIRNPPPPVGPREYEKNTKKIQK